MLFRKSIQRSCGYCTFGSCTVDGQVLCSRKGFKTMEDSCWRFRYDPCKRIPLKAKPLDLSVFQHEDFSLTDNE